MYSSIQEFLEKNSREVILDFLTSLAKELRKVIFWYRVKTILLVTILVVTTILAIVLPERFDLKDNLDVVILFAVGVLDLFILSMLSLLSNRHRKYYILYRYTMDEIKELKTLGLSPSNYKTSLSVYVKMICNKLMLTQTTFLDIMAKKDINKLLGAA